MYILTIIILLLWFLSFSFCFGSPVIGLLMEDDYGKVKGEKYNLRFTTISLITFLICSVLIALIL